MRSGMVTLLGRPNVGKSSLVNAMVGQKVTIVTSRPQTTRHRVQAVLNRDDEVQIVFVDTPGLHLGGKRTLNQVLNDTATGSIEGVDLVLLVIEAGRWTDEDENALSRVRKLDIPVGLVINKVDRFRDKAELLPSLQQAADRHGFAFVVPVSAETRDNLDALVSEISRYMPEGPMLFPPDQLVGHDRAFASAEIVREKLMRNLREELPHALAVSIEQFSEEGRLTRIEAVVWVERDGQKKIVIGEGGSVLKRVGTQARQELERMWGGRVFLRIWVRVREKWTDDPQALRAFGYQSE
jgi:GTP-binding protein Era